MVYYSRFAVTDDHTWNVIHALEYCKTHRENALVFERGTYDFRADFAAERTVHISNHCMHGIYRFVFLLEQMENFTVDGGGSTFLFHGCMTPFLLDKCRSVTLKNMIIDFPKTPPLDVLVTSAEGDAIEAVSINQNLYAIENGHFIHLDETGKRMNFRYILIRGRDNNPAYLPECGPKWLKPETVVFTDLGNGRIRMEHTGLKVSVGTNLTLCCSDKRQACNLAVSDCRDIVLEDITMYKSYGMGLICQLTENITVNRMTVCARAGEINSLGADATHFVHCRGLVRVVNSSFSEQQDDAMNVHGIFTKIVKKMSDGIIVRFMNREAKGIRIYHPGDIVKTVDPETLLENGTYEITKAEYLNEEHIVLYLKENTDSIRIDDILENVTWSCDVEFAGNRVLNNDSRGILIAVKGKVRIHNNYFHSSGTAVLFETDGQFWYESGGTNDVEIRENVFDNCKVCNTWEWGNGVIETVPRRAVRDGMYYHQRISVEENHFIGSKYPLFIADNVAEAVFRRNLTEDFQGDEMVRYCHCGSFCTDIAEAKKETSAIGI